MLYKQIDHHKITKWICWRYYLLFVISLWYNSVYCRHTCIISIILLSKILSCTHCSYFPSQPTSLNLHSFCSYHIIVPEFSDWEQYYFPHFSTHVSAHSSLLNKQMNKNNRKNFCTWQITTHSFTGEICSQAVLLKNLMSLFYHIGQKYSCVQLNFSFKEQTYLITTPPGIQPVILCVPTLRSHRNWIVTTLCYHSDCSVTIYHLVVNLDKIHLIANLL